MRWNSWNEFARAVNDPSVRGMADDPPQWLGDSALMWMMKPEDIGTKIRIPCAFGNLFAAAAMPANLLPKSAWYSPADRLMCVVQRTRLFWGTP
jgi:hypothetical protein